MDLRDALIDWDEPADEGGNTAHIAEHDLKPEEVEFALFDDNTTFDVSDSSARSPPTTFPSRRGEDTKPPMKPKRTAEQRAEEEAVRRQHAANPIRHRPAGAINRQSFTAILSLVARLKAARESQGLTLAEVAARMGIDAPALSRLETGKMLNPTLATLHKWAEALGQKLDVDLSPA